MHPVPSLTHSLECFAVLLPHWPPPPKLVCCEILNARKLRLSVSLPTPSPPDLFVAIARKKSLSFLSLSASKHSHSLPSFSSVAVFFPLFSFFGKSTTSLFFFGLSLQCILSILFLHSFFLLLFRTSLYCFFARMSPASHIVFIYYAHPSPNPPLFFLSKTQTSSLPIPDSNLKSPFFYPLSSLSFPIPPRYSQYHPQSSNTEFPSFSYPFPESNVTVTLPRTVWFRC